MALHRLLARQLKKLGCDINACTDWSRCVQLVNAAYWQADDDREMLERSLRVSSDEVIQINAELRAMMSALRESEEKYRAIFNNAPVGILQTTFDGRILDGNPAVARMLGYADRQDLLASVTNLARQVYLHPEDRQTFLEGLLASPDGLSMELEFKRQDGSAFLAIINASLQRDEQGQPTFINCTAKDITERKQAEEALRESEEKYREVIENSTDAFCRTDSEGRIDMISPSGVKLLGFASAEEMLGKPQEQFWMSPLQCTHMMVELRERGEIRDHEVVLRRKDGTPVHVALSSWLKLGPDGSVLGVGGVFRDITERKQAEGELQESAQRFHSLFDNMTEGAALHSPIRGGCGEVVDYRIEAVNRSYEQILGLRAEDVVGLPVTEAYGNDELFLDKFSTVSLSGEPAQFETYFSRQGLHLSVSIAPWSNDGISTIFFDTTERKQLEEQLLFRALHDPLTGLANRTLCLDRIAQANERALRKDGVQFAIVFIDLDRFKMINDSLGHEAGDLALREVAQRLLACTRKIDTVCRYGGDEFILVLEELNPVQVMQTIKRIRKSLLAPMIIGNQNIQIEASFGVAYAPVVDNQPEDLLRNANIALHSAKQRGRNLVVVYRPKMHKTAIQTMHLQSDMRRGLDFGEFFLVYQPLVSLENNQLTGFEALLRWEHPQRGMIRPIEFIPLAEKSGFIFELGQFVVGRACKDMAFLLRTVSDETNHLTLSVNISPRQFSRWGLADQIEQAMADNSLPPSALVLEITESSIMKYPEASANMLARLKERGMGIAIDDFGTGYSSMSALQKLPLDRLKIDMSFVRRITESDEDREIVRAIITLARSLHLKTVAEGIETDDQRQLLKEMGCDLGQGYLFSRPMPLAEVSKSLRQKTWGKQS